ncbi:MAG: hypothetical protein ACLR17_02285 [Enterobacteriaceae bacterium]
MKSIILVFAMLLALGQASTALAACSIKTSAPAIGPVDSFALNSAPQGVMAGAFTAPGTGGAELNQYVSATLASANKSNGVPRLLNGAGDAILIASVLTPRARRPIRTAA